MGRERILTWRGRRGRGLKLEAPRRESDLHMGSETRERAPGDGLEDTARGGGVCTEGYHTGLQQAGPRPGRASGAEVRPACPGAGVWILILHLGHRKGENGGSHHTVGGGSLAVVAFVMNMTPPKLLHPGWRWRQMFGPLLLTGGGEG